MHQEIPEMDRAGLRKFGLVTGGMFAVLFGLFFPWLLTRPTPYWPWALGGLLAFWALLAPMSMNGFYRSWMRLAMGLGRITTPVIMGVVFFLVVTPLGLLMRIARRDALARRFEPTARSYRVPSRTPPRTHMERPF